jgi:predicted nuclease with TOPRIM domain
MDKEEILNTLGEVQYELAKVKRKLNYLDSQSIRYKEIYPELDSPVRVLQGINNEIYETIEIEKWVLMNSMN